MAGTIPLSMTQQLDIYGKPLAGGQLYIMVAGTVSTPQDAFQDSALSIKMPYPMTLDAAGRVPQFFLADGTVKIRLQDKNGVVQLAADSVLVIGPSAGGGGGAVTVDPTALIQTGNMILRYGVGALSGYVRMNGLSIGSTTSGATERANPDCQNLFQYLWLADTNLAVSGGRGANAAADWTANKNIALPDWRGYNVSALDDMGNAAAGRMQGFFANPTVLGAVGGIAYAQLAQANLPPHTHGDAGGTANESATHTHTYTSPATPVGLQGGSTYPAANISSGSALTTTESASHFHRFSVDNGPGSSAQFPTFSPRKLCTIYLKL